MTYSKQWLMLGLFVSASLFSGCIRLRYQEPGPNDARTLQALHQRLSQNTGDAITNRDLGAAYIRLNQSTTARPYIEAAYARTPDDPKTLFYMGLMTEMEIGMQEALSYYVRYPVTPPASPYRKIMKGRQRWISEELIREDMRARLAEENTMKGQGVDQDAIAVFPLRFVGSDSSFAYLGRAFSELVVTDLMRVPSIKLVERIRIQTLLDELEMAREGMLDPSVSPEVGRLLGAGHVTGGSLSLFDSKGLVVDFASWKAEEQTDPDFLRHGGRLIHFFAIEKEVVFSLIRALNIELTPKQRDDIEYIPTQNMQAIMAYSLGLMYEDRGLYAEAAHAFQEASTFDPAFQQAQFASSRASDAAAGAGSTETIVNAANAMDSGEDSSDSVDLVGLRMSLSGGGAIQGRQPAAEAASAGNPILTDPPALPGLK